MKLLKGMFHVGYFMLILLFLEGVSCTVHENKDNDKSLPDSVFIDLKKIKVDSLRNIRSFWGRYQLNVMECWSNDSCKNITLLLIRNEANDINLKIERRLITTDSLEYLYPITEFGFSKERIIYTFRVMEELKIDELYASCNSEGFVLEKDGLKFYYLFDTLYIPEYIQDTNLIKLDGNWWLKEY